MQRTSGLRRSDSRGALPAVVLVGKGFSPGPPLPLMQAVMPFDIPDPIRSGLAEVYNASRFCYRARTLAAPPVSPLRFASPHRVAPVNVTLCPTDVWSAR